MRRFGRGARSAPRPATHAIGLDAGTIRHRPETTGKLIDACWDGVHGSEVAVLADGRVIDAIAIEQGCHDIEQTVLAHVYRRHRVLAAPHAVWHALRLGSAVAFTAAVRRLAGRTSQRLDRDALEQGLVVVGGGSTWESP